jgi:hypothetical protein
MSGLGLAPFGYGPFGTVYSPDSETERGSVPESQYVSVDGLYAFKANGSFEGANNSAQRVIVLLALRATRPSKIGPDFVAEQEASVRAALSTLTSGPAPAIEIQAIEVRDDGKRTTTTRVAFADLLDGGRVKEVSL